MALVEYRRDAVLRLDGHRIEGAIHAIGVLGAEFSAPSRDVGAVPEPGAEGLVRIEVLPRWMRAAMSLGEAAEGSSLWSTALVGDESEEELVLRCRVKSAEKRAQMLRRPHTFLSLEFVDVKPSSRNRLEAIVREAESALE